MNFAQRLTEIQSRIAKACSKAGRAENDAQLLAVSKTQPIEAILEAYEAGVRHFGENYVQELSEKCQALSHLGDIQWHLIGPLQSNKVAAALKNFHYFHALDSEKLVTQLSIKAKAAALQKKPAIFVQVNVDDEGTKSGVDTSDVLQICQAVAASDTLLLAGLMCIPEPKPTAQQMRPAFQRMQVLAKEIQKKLQLKHSLQLSMGMSEDFEVAIEEGANWVRVGRALFGERRKKN